MREVVIVVCSKIARWEGGGGFHGGAQVGGGGPDVFSQKTLSREIPSLLLIGRECGRSDLRGMLMKVHQTEMVCYGSVSLP